MLFPVAGVFLTNCIIWGLSYLGRLSWTLDLASIYRPIYFMVFLVCLFGFLLLKKFIWALACGVFLLVASFSVTPFLLPHKPSPDPNDHTRRILFHNIKKSNTDYAGFVGLVKRHDPDIVIVAELTYKCKAYLASHLRGYPYIHTKPKDDFFGIGIFSKIPFQKSRVHYLQHRDFPVLEVACNHEGLNFTVFSTHTSPPINKTLYANRNRQLVNLGKIVSKNNGEKLIIADLNISMWSSYLKEFLEECNLKNGRRGHGFKPTYPSQGKMPRVTIDHVLVSEGITIEKITTSDSAGSDHLSVVCEFTVKQ